MLDPKATKQADGKIRLTWTPDLTCFGYRFYRDGVAVSKSTNPGQKATTFAAETDGKPHWYGIARALEQGPESVQFPADVPPPTGLPTHGVSTGYQGIFSAQQTRNLDLCKEAGAQIIRYDVTNAAQFDSAVKPLDAAVVARGMESLMILHGSTDPVTAAQADALARYVAPKTPCRLFEFTNEPDLNSRWTPVQYADAAHGFCAALRAVRPDATLILGANWKWKTDTTGEGIDAWVQQVVARWQTTTIPSFDLWSFHLYDDDTWNDPRNIWQQVFGPLPAPRIPAKTRLANAGINVGICSTENGGPYPKYTLTQQATLVTKDFQAVADGRLAFHCVYSMMPDTPELSGFAMVDTAGAKRPSFTAYKTGAAA